MGEMIAEETPAPEVETPAVETTAEVETPAAETPAPEPVAAEPNWNDIGFWNQIQERAAQLGYALTPAQVEEAKTDAIPTPDPFADDYAQQLERWYEAKQAAALGPVEQFIQAQQQERVDSAINGIIQTAAEQAQLGELDDTGRQVLRGIADAFAPQAGQRFGAGPQAAQQAAKMATDWITARDKTVADKAVEAYKQSLTEGGGNLLDTPVRGAGVPAGREFKDELEYANNYSFRPAA